VTDPWQTIIGVAAVCLLMRVAVPLILGERQPALLTRALDRAVPALLAALVVTGTFANGQQLSVDPRVAGVTAAGLIALARLPILAALLAGAATTALIRLIA